MWSYSTTTDTTACSAAENYTAGATSFGSTEFTDTAGDGILESTQTSANSFQSLATSPFATHFSSSSSSGGSFTQSQIASQVGGVFSASGSTISSNSFESTAEFTKTITKGTTFTATTNDGEDSPGTAHFHHTGSGSTTLSGSTTAVRTRDTYHSSTQTTTSATVAQTTTTQTFASAGVTTTSGNATTTATHTVTQTVSTTSNTTATVTTYANAASASLTTAEYLVPITQIEVSEQGWEFTVAANSAGYASDVASTFTARTGTIATSSTTYNGTTYATSTVIGSTHSVGTLTLGTLVTETVVDTYVPFLGKFPATSTATRSFTMVTADVTTFTADIYGQVTLSVHQAVGFTNRVLTYSSVTETLNVSPTQTTTAAVAVTFFTTVSAHSASPAVTPTSFSLTEQATGTNSENYTTSASTSHNTTSTATTSVTTTTAITNHLYQTTVVGSDTTTSTFGDSATDSIYSSVVDTIHNIVHYLVSQSTTTESFSNFTESSFSLVISDSLASQSSTTSVHFVTWQTITSQTYGASGFYIPGVTVTPVSAATITSGPTGAQITTTTVFDNPFSTSTTYTTDSNTFVDVSSVSSTTTENTTNSVSTTTSSTTAVGTSSGSSQSFNEGYSITSPVLAPQETFNGSAPWTVADFHPAQGFRDPQNLSSTDSLFYAMSVASGSFYYPYVATQDDVAGAITPMLFFGTRSYSTGASFYTVSWDSTASKLNYTSGVTSTLASGTVTYTVVSNSTTGDASFVGASAETYFGAAIMSVDSAGSAMGGIAAESQYGADFIGAPGVRHTTRVDSSSSTSGTSWLQTPEQVTSTGLAHAVPTRTETAFSVDQAAAATSKPMATLSLYPNL